MVDIIQKYRASTEHKTHGKGETNLNFKDITLKSFILPKKLLSKRKKVYTFECAVQLYEF